VEDQREVRTKQKSLNKQKKVSTMTTTKKYIMDNYTAVGIAEGFIESESQEQEIAAWQYLVDTGICWQLQGYFGRTAHALIEAGVINHPLHTND
jgi:hypothetical protein